MKPLLLDPKIFQYYEGPDEDDDEEEEGRDEDYDWYAFEKAKKRMEERERETETETEHLTRLCASAPDLIFLLPTVYLI